MKTKSLNTSNTGLNPIALFGLQIRNLKKDLPKACTNLSPYKNFKGEYYVRAIVNDMEYLFNIPKGFVFKSADLTELKNQILSKCEENVTERN